ncbi:MAG: efflux RND transporter permease subunit [Elusimicrobiota bacterium]
MTHGQHTKKTLGLAGGLAQAFIRSKLTPLIIIGSLLLGAFALANLPREEEPQIDVPMFDIYVPFPGASAKEVEERVVDVGERKLWEIPGVEYIYTTAERGFALFIVRFEVGTDPEEAMTRVYTKTFANIDLLSRGASQPLIKPRLIDDVPILSLTLWSRSKGPLALRRSAAALRQEISAVDDVSDIEIIGGRRRQLLVHLDPDKLAQRRLTPLEVAAMVQASNQRLPAGHYNKAGKAVLVETDAFIRSAEDLRRVVLGVSQGRPVLLGHVARITDGPDEDETSVLFGSRGSDERYPAVTLSVSKRRGANATRVADHALERVESVRASGALRDVEITVTRNYGETAKHKSDELIFHMWLATLSVTALIALTLGLREAFVVLIAIPVTLSLTLLIYFLSGYTLNRITLFALIFSIGILVDDAIVVIENIHRHYVMRDGRSLWQLSVDAVDEVGNPTFLATWTVIAAILPMAFVRGLMGPYMRPIPVGASVAMLFSLGVAFIVSPWAFARLLDLFKPRGHAEHEEGRLDKLYRRFMHALLQSARLRWAYLAGVLALLAASVSLVYFKAVTVKMLPFDNKDEFEVVLTMPEGTGLGKTRQAASEIGDYLRSVPEVRHVTEYAGAAAPFNFNGLVRHYYMRTRPHHADILVNLAGRKERKRQSHDITKAVRPRIHEIARAHKARVQVAEVPPGPPVLSTLVFEIYDPDPERRTSFARELRKLLEEESEGITDVDTYVPDPQPLDRLRVDMQKATLNGIPPVRVAETVSLALHGYTAGLAHVEGENEPVEIRLRLPESRRRDLSAVESIGLLSRNGTLIRLRELTERQETEADQPIYHKNLQPVAYVIADVSGKQESPVYAIMSLRGRIDELARESGIALRQYYARQPESSLESAMKWDGEWHITYEVFRDLGIAFALVLILMYVLIVAWFRSFLIPLVIMTPIPLTLVGILPGHWGMGAFFTATSMIGFIAGAGIVVRNSIILVDFIHLRLAEGMPLEEAVVDAGAVRFRPMLLTAAAVVVGAGVILFDPIFQGLAISLIAGEVASTLLSRTSVPILYYVYGRTIGG